MEQDLAPMVRASALPPILTDQVGCLLCHKLVDGIWLVLGKKLCMQKQTQILGKVKNRQADLKHTPWVQVYLITLVTSAPTGGHAAGEGQPAGGSGQ